MKAIYPGSFDPVTNGHTDIIERAAKLFDEVIIAVSHNVKKSCVFSIEERLEMLRHTTAHIPNVTIDICAGLLADYARDKAVPVMIRGLRAVSDFEIELKHALMNRHLNPELETVFLMTRARYLFLNSSIIREIASFDGDVQDFVPPYVVECLKKKYNYTQDTNL